MKISIISFLLVFLSFRVVSFNPIQADTVRLDGKLILYLSSDDYWQDGYNYGYLLGYRIKPFLENYLISVVMGGTEMYKTARSLFDKHFVTDQKYVDISRGIISGMKDSGIDLYLSSLKDTLNYKDLLILNSVPDFTAFLPEWNGSAPGCSSLSSWGDATRDDADLTGETVISRNLDWYTHPLLVENALIVVWKTRKPDKQSFVSFGYSGVFGALSGVNESGVATFQNMGNYFLYPTGTGFYPVNLAMRDGLEARDFNGDGISSARDITDAIKLHKISSSYIIHSIGPSATQHNPEILEIHNSFGHKIRTKADNPPAFGDNLVATNHFIKLKPANYCFRYQIVADSLAKFNKLSNQRSWNIIKAAGVNLTMQTINYNTANRKIRFSFATNTIPAHLNNPTEVSVNDLLTLNTLKLKCIAWLEGPYNPETGLMKTTLKSLGLLPLSQPYNAIPWNYTGEETVESIPVGVVDWIFLELREAPIPDLASTSTIVARRAAFLLNNGLVVDLDGISPVDFDDVQTSIGNSLYLVLRHRNHIDLISAYGIAKDNLGLYYYDFSKESNIYGKQAGYIKNDHKCLMVSGDINVDGKVSVTDYNHWAISYGQANGYFSSDLDMDGNSFVTDYNRWARSFGKVSIGIINYD